MRWFRSVGRHELSLPRARHLITYGRHRAMVLQSIHVRELVFTRSLVIWYDYRFRGGPARALVVHRVYVSVRLFGPRPTYRPAGAGRLPSGARVSARSAGARRNGGDHSKRPFSPGRGRTCRPNASTLVARPRTLGITGLEARRCAPGGKYYRAKRPCLGSSEIPSTPRNLYKRVSLFFFFFQFV